METVKQTLIIESTMNGFNVTDPDDKDFVMSFESKDTMRDYIVDWLEQTIDGDVSFDETHDPNERFVISFEETTRCVAHPIT